MPVPKSNSPPYIAPEHLPNLDPVPNNATAAINGEDVIRFFGPDGNGGGTAYVQDQRLIFNFWTGGAHLSSPPTPYPFTRLSWSNDTANGGTYVYHQLSETTMVEDAYFVTSGWHTTNITLAFTA